MIANSMCGRLTTSVLAVSALVAFMVLFAPVTVVAQTTHFTVPFDFPEDNPCNGEPVMITGTSDMSSNTNVDSDGGIHVTVHFVTKGEGFGVTTGARYLFSQEQSLIHNMSGSSQADISTDVLNQILNANGPTPNFLLKMTAHFTINGQGVPKPPVLNSFTKCAG
jgi:hypothetical protein